MAATTFLLPCQVHTDVEAQGQAASPGSWQYTYSRVKNRRYVEDLYREAASPADYPDDRLPVEDPEPATLLRDYPVKPFATLPRITLWLPCKPS